ncbi:unnamed protein product [Citrullus colocynthis]|uniref:Uncharacterized protein n=1 Tax=Citrullus colocynthis TaxID=252529 RepID=A0ABP0XNJ4_9ROSI
MADGEFEVDEEPVGKDEFGEEEVELEGDKWVFGGVKSEGDTWVEQLTWVVALSLDLDGILSVLICSNDGLDNHCVLIGSVEP